MSEAFETQFAVPERDGRSPGDMHCQARDCQRDAVTWCPLCEKVLCREHDELTPRRMHDCLAGVADDTRSEAELEAERQAVAEGVDDD